MTRRRDAGAHPPRYVNYARRQIAYRLEADVLYSRCTSDYDYMRTAFLSQLVSPASEAGNTALRCFPTRHLAY